jgi:hypothetical protein
MRSSLGSNLTQPNQLTRHKKPNQTKTKTTGEKKRKPKQKTKKLKKLGTQPHHHPQGSQPAMDKTDFHQYSSSPLTISTVGVLGSILRIRFRSALVTTLGVMGTSGENGW